MLFLGSFLALKLNKADNEGRNKMESGEMGMGTATYHFQRRTSMFDEFGGHSWVGGQWREVIRVTQNPILWESVNIVLL
jgi:hypothetical protein